MSEPAAEVAVRGPASRRRIEEWALVLAAAGVPHRIAPGGGGVELHVAERDRVYAALALDAYDREEGERAAARAVPVPAVWGPTLAGLVLAGALLVFYRVTGARAGASAWFAHGSAVAGRVLAGEPWRVVTALTLHAGPAHVLGNAVASAVFVTAVCHALGPGLGLGLVLLAGALGNVLNALVHPATHASVGASTAIFGAVGILAGRAAAYRQRRVWIALAAGLALLGLLGTGEGADLGAHLAGFLAGAGLGAAVGLARVRPPGRRVQAGLALLTAAVAVGCWLRALA